MNAKKIALTFAVCALFVGQGALGAVLIEWQEGTADNPFANWASERFGNDDPAFWTIASGGSSGPLDINPNTTGDATVHSDVHYTTASALIGDLPTKYGVTGDNPYLQFNFYYDSSAGPQNGLGFYFASTSGREWYYDIDSNYVSAGWNTFRLQLDYDADPYPSGNSLWYRENSGSESETDFNTDIANVSRVGFWIAYNENTTQGHKLGLYGVSVPEPETYLILGMALLSVAIVFRKRISESLAEARSMMRT